MKKNSSAVITVLYLAAVVSFSAIVLLSCGRDNDDPSLSGNTGQVSKVRQVDCDTAIVAANVSMGNDPQNPKIELFVPDTVTIKKNETVKWTNNDTNNWWVKSDEETVPADMSFYSGPFGYTEPKNTYCLKFTVAGTFNYHCAPTVKGVVIVE